MDPTIPQRSWWSRNWKWFVPVGCFTLLATCCALPAGIALVAIQGMKSSGVYKDAVATATSHPKVIEVLGEPIEPSWMMELQIHNSETKLRLPLQGSKAAGTLYVQARQEGDGISYDRLDLVTGGRTIDLLPESGVARPPPPEPPEPPEPKDEEPSDLTVEARTDRPGADYRDYELEEPDAAQCALDCSMDERCLAYTYVKPAGAAKARCRLKNQALPKVKSDCCVSGVKQ